MCDVTISDLQHRRQDAWYVNELAADGIGKMARAARVALRDMFPAFTSLGMYTIEYLTHDGSIICADCAKADYTNGDGRAEGSVYWEGPTMFCEGCNAEIASAYGDPDDENAD